MYCLRIEVPVPTLEGVRRLEFLLGTAGNYLSSTGDRFIFTISIMMLNNLTVHFLKHDNNKMIHFHFLTFPLSQYLKRVAVRHITTNKRV